MPDTALNDADRVEDIKRRMEEIRQELANVNIELEKIRESPIKVEEFRNSYTGLNVIKEFDRKLEERNIINQKMKDNLKIEEIEERNKETTEAFRKLQNEERRQIIIEILRDLETKQKQSAAQKRSVAITVIFLILGIALSVAGSFVSQSIHIESSQSILVSQSIIGIAVSIACVTLYRQFLRSW